MSERREPHAWEFFRAHGALWQAVGEPQDLGGVVGRALRAGMVMWYELPADPAGDPTVKLDEIQWVRCAEIGAVLNPDETMEAHLSAFVKRESSGA